MAKFLWLGEEKLDPPQQWVKEYGPCEEIKVPQKDGKTIVVKAPPGGFPINSIIPYDFTDERSIRVLRADPRFQEVV